MPRYFIQLSYKGTAFNGWQKQNNAPSVQAALEKGLSTLLRATVDVIGAGRTDTGVHAMKYVAHFDSQYPIEAIDDFIFHLNLILPYEIAIQHVFMVKPNAHARFDALWRTYKYHIVSHKNPFTTEFAYLYKQPLDVNLMNRACALLYEYDDFTSFCKLHSDNKTNICHIMHAAWVEENEMLVFTIQADRFLRNMVRAIVGTLLHVGAGKLTLEAFRQVIEAKNRNKAGTSAPAHALYFADVVYDEAIKEVIP